MVSPHPFHKRVLSRVCFYGGVACYLWLLQFVEQQATNRDLSDGTSAADVTLSLR
jgi:hypothetical protein